MSKAAEKIRAKKAERARENAALKPGVSNTTPSPEEAAAQIAKLKRDLERSSVHTKQLLDAERLKAKRAEARAQQIEQEREREKLRTEVLKRATALGAIDPEDVADLASARFQFVRSPEGKIVRSDDATQDLDSALKSMLDTKPHLVRSTVAPGTGTAPTQRASGPAAPAPKSFREDPNAALRALVERETSQSAS